MPAPRPDIASSNLPRSRGARRRRRPAADPLIRTKLYRPELTGDHVSRGRLLKLMDRTLSVPLTVVAAPAGYGKSTLVSEWLTLQQCPWAWLSLDATESELAPFLNYLLAAVETASAGTCGDTRALLGAPDLPSATTVATYLVNDLDRLAEPLLLVFDDYHALRRSSPVHAVVETLLEYAPRALHLVLITRSDLPWSLTGLRAKGRVSEPSSRELCFTPIEANEFLGAAGCAIESALVGKLDARIEGWPVGWRLLLQALRHSGQSEAVLDELTGTVPDIQRYLFGEVLEQQAPEARDYLLQTAVLERFCPELVDAVCRPQGGAAGEIDGRTFAELLQRDGLFVISLDASNRWLRYHHVFQELLEAELRRRWSRAEVDALHLRASRWLEQHGFTESAIRHALAGANAIEAAKIVERHRHEELDHERWHSLQTWLDLIPAAVKRERLESLLAVAWVSHFTGGRDALILIVRAIEARLADEEPRGIVLAEVHLFRGLAAYWTGNGAESQRCFDKVIELAAGDEELYSAVAQVFLALARHRNGEGAAAREALRLQILAGPTNPLYLVRLVVAKGFMHLLSADAAAVPALARQAEELAVQAQSVFGKVWATYMRASPALQMYRLPEAKEHFSRAVASRLLVEKRTAADAMAGFALTLQLLGETERAQDVARDMLEFLADAADDCAMLAESCAARLALLRGDLDAAVRWANGLEHEHESKPLRFVIWIDNPPLTRIRVRIAEGTERGLHEALEAIGALKPQLEAAQFAAHTIEITVLEALALAKRGEHDAARVALHTALTPAAPGSWVRPFIEAPVGSLLETFLESAEHGPFVRLIAASRQSTDSAPGAPPVQAAADSERRRARRADLTNRELDILELAAQRLQNKEIAARLHLSEHTVKDHLKHIYQKLGVNKRSQAIATAAAAGILE